MHYNKLISCLLVHYCILITVLTTSSEEEIFKQNIGKDMEIGVPDQGYKSVKLKCGSDSMHVDLETEDDFSGVIYTRGSFHDKDSPCYLDPGYQRGQRSFSMRFPLDRCKTLQKGEVYSNVLVVQNDKDLIMPGDAAFNLECDFRQSRNLTVNADLQKKVISKIAITNPDVGGEENRPKRSVESNSDTVEFRVLPSDRSDTSFKAPQAQADTT